MLDPTKATVCACEGFNQIRSEFSSDNAEAPPIGRWVGAIIKIRFLTPSRRSFSELDAGLSTVSSEEEEADRTLRREQLLSM
ncbi:hypothetical protein HBH98_187320 [Parastagonospora nodorum]|nr:hypothetical protein HBI09_166470 [Parastagonospora nodorum]KAH4050908.1 hypothetical protein HBH49_125090 [Parastagonospora nodorum]KAH4093338.1 hypothetical protein HBH46_178360 [Parastagonospora nodorum]KAH4233935.1 hypothetical protein HBI05_158330 [Parastagonospora nodorum]KAH4260571.1 hypothetical protein HBI03_125700 [Parastagonospora nodorum]